MGLNGDKIGGVLISYFGDWGYWSWLDGSSVAGVRLEGAAGVLIEFGVVEGMVGIAEGLGVVGLVVVGVFHHCWSGWYGMVGQWAGW